ncbi:MAG: endonuclease MutS2 [Deltaproteobacteria bacterium]|nr:endonuclease MutS2 [Deltaproteobacteria bacterium]
MIPQNSLDLLEFNKLLEIIAQRAKSDASRNAILSIKPLSSRDEIQRRFSLIGEIRRMSQDDRPLSILPFNDIAPVLQKVRPEDAMLEPSELVWLMDFFMAGREAALQIRAWVDLTPTPVKSILNELISNLTGRPELLRILNRTVDRDGNILDSASPMLAELRSEKRRLENKIKKQLEKIIQDEKTAVFLQDTFITQRSGRWVLPVRMDSKGQVPGVVHDVSRTGETAFVEPIAVIGLSNEYENIVAEEKAEVMRILRELGSRVREITHEIEGEFKTLVFLDLLNSIAGIAEEFHMQMPKINEQNVLHLVNAKHPLLLHAAMKKNPPVSPFSKGGVKDFPPLSKGGEVGFLDEISPIDVRLGGDKPVPASFKQGTVMVITGPNAGGKTVAIKTIGLLSAMAVSGIPVPADSSTSIPLFHNLLVDIGDRQSIADNLSTFTAHLANMKEFLSKADSKTLVLIDEMGTGTDPEEGAALACAILKELKEKDSMIFATTHLTDIKVFAHKQDGMLNASMEFDQNTHAPLYSLRTGEPGQSFAIETAKRYGLPEGLIQSAKMMLGKRKADFESLIQSLDQKRKEYEGSLEQVMRQKAELKAREEQAEKLIGDAEVRRKEMLANAYKEASEIIVDIKRQMQAIFEEIKKSSKDKAKELLKDAVSAQEQVIENIRQYEAVETEPLSIDELKQGDVVFVKSVGYDATIVKILKKKNRLKVKAGNMEMEMPLSDVRVKKGIGIEKGKGEIKISIPEKAVESQINIIGLRVDEALPKLEKFLNDATLAGLSEVIIIHGVGMGILAKAVQGHLSEHPLVKSFRGGEQSEGGGGVTVVSLK